MREMKRQKEYMTALGYVADSEYGIPTRCPCGSSIIDEVRGKEDYDTLPGKRFFSCKNFEDDGFHYRQPWVIGVQEEIERLTKRQEAVRKDFEHTFGVLQARFAIVNNPALLWDKVKIGRIMRACVILHNMIVENERDGYTQYDTSYFVTRESSKSSQIDLSFSMDIPSNIGNMLAIRSELQDQHIHDRLKADLVKNIWQKFGNLDE